MDRYSGAAGGWNTVKTDGFVRFTVFVGIEIFDYFSIFWDVVWGAVGVVWTLFPEARNL